MPEELLYELRERTTSVTIKEFTDHGVRVSYNFQGEMKGQYSGARLETVDALFRPDGSGEFEVRAIDQTVDGDLIIIPAKGTTKQVSPTSLQVKATGSFQTMSKKLAWLNSAKGRFEGTFNPATGEVVGKVFATR